MNEYQRNSNYTADIEKKEKKKKITISRGKDAEGEQASEEKLNGSQAGFLETCRKGRVGNWVDGDSSPEREFRGEKILRSTLLGLLST